MEITPEIRTNFKVACRTVAQRLRDGFVPGREVCFNPDGSPCCSIGHVLSEAGLGDSIHEYADFADLALIEDCRTVYLPNDDQDFPAVAVELDQIADRLDGAVF